VLKPFCRKLIDDVWQFPIRIDQKLNRSAFAFKHHTQLDAVDAVVLIWIGIAAVEGRCEFNNAF
jgi:hypothetical protein